MLGREHTVLVYRTSVVEYMLGTKQNNMATSADNPGVVVLPPLLYGSALVVVLALRWFWPMPIFGHAVALWSGLALIVFAVAIAIWGRRTMHAAGTNISPLRPTTAVVTTGPFRFSRNPLYLALTILYLGLTLAFNTWWGICRAGPTSHHHALRSCLTRGTLPRAEVW